MDVMLLERDLECDPSLLPSLAIECIFEHYIQAGTQSQTTLWGAQEWLAQQSPLIGSAEFCNAARRAHRGMGPLVAGMRLSPWPGIDHVPNPLSESSVTFVVGLPGPSGKTVCANALAKEYSTASCKGHSGTRQHLPTAISIIPMDFISPGRLSMIMEWVATLRARNVLKCDQSISLACVRGKVRHPLEDMAQIVRAANNVHLIVTAQITQNADPRVTSSMDRVVIIAGPLIALDRARLAGHMAEMLGANQKALALFIDALPAYAQLVIERRQGCARDDPLHHSNVVIQVKPATVLS